MPNHVHNEITILGEPEVVAVLAESVRSVDRPFDFNRIIPRPPFIGTDGVTLSDREENPNRNSYDWQIAHWGTKWNAYDFDVTTDASRYAFYTAWSPPIPVIRELSQLFPELQIQLTFIEEFDEVANCVWFENSRIVGETPPVDRDDLIPGRS